MMSTKGLGSVVATALLTRPCTAPNATAAVRHDPLGAVGQQFLGMAGRLEFGMGRAQHVVENVD